MTNLSREKEERAYRKKLRGDGLIYLGFNEYPIQVINLSITGLLAQFKIDTSVKDIFESIRISPIVDIYFPDIRVGGEAEVVRAESTEQGIQIAIEFRNLSYDVDNLLYSRRAYRKSMTSLGQAIINDTAYSFNTENVSVDGIMIHVKGIVNAPTGTTVHLSFTHLELQGDCEIVWIERDAHSTLLGLRYLYLVRDSFLEHVPLFGRHEKHSG